MTSVVTVLVAAVAVVFFCSNRGGGLGLGDAGQRHRRIPPLPAPRGSGRRLRSVSLVEFYRLSCRRSSTLQSRSCRNSVAGS